MPQLRVALAQVDTAVGDIDGNAALAREWARRARDEGAHVVVFPEMTLTGYPPEDLVFRRSFAEASCAALDRLARDLDTDGLGDLAVVVGYLDVASASQGVESPGGVRTPTAQNAAALLHGGQVVTRYAKHHLPTYGVFDEDRYFLPGDAMPVVRLHGVDVCMAVCEDLWVEGGPFEAVRQAQAGLVLVLNGSPFEQGKDDAREQLAADRARECGAPLAYVNLTGGQDELVFDGGSFVVDADGDVVARARQFTEELLVCDLELAGAASDDEPADAPLTIRRTTVSTEPLDAWEPRERSLAEPLDDLAELWQALVVGTRDYVRKNGFPSVVLGLSGGVDSAITATIAVDALGGENVHTVALPSNYSSEHSIDDADELARRQGTQHVVVPVASSVDALMEATQATGGLHGTAEENLQARVRGVLLMGLSNEHGHLVLTTGNKSELAVGYSTLYGDSAGGYAPIKDVYKSLVWDLCRWRNADARSRGEEPPIPENSIDKPPSAELRPDQVDSDSLPPYDVLDKLLEDYVDKDMGRDRLLEAGHDPEVVERIIRLVDIAEYKRRQYPPGPKTSLKAFGRDRRLPITNRWREPVTEAADAGDAAGG